MGRRHRSRAVGAIAEVRFFSANSFTATVGIKSIFLCKYNKRVTKSSKWNTNVTCAGMKQAVSLVAMHSLHGEGRQADGNVLGSALRGR
jgi:hypothetical protein